MDKMKMAVLALCGTVAMGLAACDTTGLTPHMTPAAQVAAAKAEYAAEAAYNLAANAYLGAESYLNPAQKVTVKGYMAQAYEALLAARNAETLGDTTTLAAKITALQSLAAEVGAITGPVTPATAKPSAWLAPPADGAPALNNMIASLI